MAQRPDPLAPPALASRRRFLRRAGGAVVGAATAGSLVGGALSAGCDRAEASGDDSPRGHVTLRLWTWALRPRFDDYMGRLVADFEATRPGVRVEWSDVAYDAMQRKTFAAGAAGAMPDVINFSGIDFPQFASLGALLPLGGGLPGDPAERFVPGALEACVIDGALLGLPWYLSTAVRMMNTRLLAEGGLTPETIGGDWDALIAQAGPFHERTGRYLFTLPLGSESDLPAMMLADGIDPLVPDPKTRYRSNLTSPAVVAFLRKWVDFYRSGAVPRSAATGAYEEMVVNLTAGRVAVINANALNRVRDQAPQIYESIAVGPAIVGTLGLPRVSLTQICVARRTRHRRLAGELAWHVTGPKWQTKLAVMASRVPSTVESLSDPAFSTANPADPLQVATVLAAEQLPDARAFAPAIGPWPDLQRAFDEPMKRVLLEGTPVEQALAAIDAEWDRILTANAEGVPYK